MTSLKQIVCNIYLVVLFIIYPLYQHNGYYDMGDAKYKFYLISTIVFLVLLGVTIITDPDTYKSSKKTSKKKSKVVEKKASELSFTDKIINLKNKFMAWFMPKSIVEKFVWAYLVCAIISFIFGIDHYTGFFGADGWYMGLLIQCLMIAGFFVFAKVWKPDMLPFYYAMIGSVPVMILGIVMRFGIDPLGNYEALDIQYVRAFISTIGQTSWYSSYICTVIPIGVALFFVIDEGKKHIFYAIYSFVAFIAIAISDSDSILLGVAGMLMVLFWIAFANVKYMLRFWEITTILAGAFVIIEIIKKMFEGNYNGMIEASSVKMADIKIYIVGVMISLSILVVLAVLKKTRVLDKIYSSLKTIYVLRGITYILILIVVVGAVLYIALNTMGVFGVTEDMLPWNGSIWFFNNDWGHHRGVSWRVCWMIFSDYSIGRKIVGIGPDSLAVVTQSFEKYANMVASKFGEEQILTCAHNEFYNHIVVYGLLGGISYLLIYIFGIIRYIKEFVTKPIIIAGAACVAAYMGHNIFCYQTVICTPFIFVIIGICEAWLNQ